ncbi:MAG TPA: 50S ribosomal protein L6 [Candidatus Bathyarchaeia archaeon]|nr:50S ribosomal protein L6 [Candidatus Bathyarchaeia archaeon]
MSRIGLKPIEIPENVTVKTDAGSITVSGPLGTLEAKIVAELSLETDQGRLLVKRRDDSKRSKSLHGLVRSLIFNMILGVSKGWQKELEIQGTGYRAKIEKGNLILSLGFSHPVEIKPETGIKFEVKDEREITISGIDKTLVGDVTARIRKVKPPDAYKGKGIRYKGERVVLKPGKAGKVGSAGGSAGAA